MKLFSVFKRKTAKAAVNLRFGGLQEPDEIFSRTTWGMSPEAIMDICKPLTLIDSGKVLSLERPEVTETSFLINRTAYSEIRVCFGFLRNRLFEFKYKLDQYKNEPNFPNVSLSVFNFQSAQLHKTYGEPSSRYTDTDPLINIAYGFVGHEEWNLPNTNIQIARSSSEDGQRGLFLQHYWITPSHDYLFSEAS